MKTILVTLIFLMITLAIQGFYEQNFKLDSLVMLLDQNPKEDTVSFNLLVNIASESINFDPELSLSYAKEALELAKKLNLKKGKAKSFQIIGRYNCNKSEYPKPFITIKNH